jgi:hypothetical protein
MFFVMLQNVIMLSVVVWNVLKRLIISIGEVMDESLVLTNVFSI